MFGSQLTVTDAERRGVALVSIAEAAALAGVSIRAISARLDRGTLTTYLDPDAPNPRRGRRLVDRAEL